MLVEYTLSNFKSFNNSDGCGVSEGISLKKDNVRSKPDHIIHRDLLKTSMVFGPNASGKSNLISGLKYIRDLIVSGSRFQRTYEVPYCRILPENKDKPIRFQFCIQTNNNFGKYRNIKNYKRVLPASNRYRYTIEFSCSEDTYFCVSYESLEIIVAGKYEFVYEYDDSKIRDKFSHHPTSELITRREEIMKELDSLEHEVDQLSVLRELFNQSYQEYRMIESNVFDLKENLDKIKNHDDNNFKILSIKYSRSEEYLIESRKKYENYKKSLDDARLKYDLNVEKISNLRHQLSFLNQETHSASYRSTIRSPILAMIANRRFPENIFEKVNEEIWIDATSDVYNWFLNTLEIVDPDSFVTDLMDPDNVKHVSDIVSEMDVGIDKLGWYRLKDHEEIDDLLSSLSHDDRRRIGDSIKISENKNILCTLHFKKDLNIYQLIVGRGVILVDKLISYHRDGSCHDLCEESDGTRRVIELASILIPSHSPKVYVVDELDCRIHPLLVRYFVEQFFKDDSEDSQNKQLIFTTHDVGLMRTDLFRADEIWFVDHDQESGSHISSASEYKRAYNAKLSKLYLEDKVFGGVPCFREIQDLEEDF